MKKPKNRVIDFNTKVMKFLEMVSYLGTCTLSSVS